MSATRTNRGGSPTAVNAVGTETLDPYAAPGPVHDMREPNRSIFGLSNHGPQRGGDA